MNIPVLQEELIIHHQQFLAYVNELSEQEFSESKNGKWSPGQQLAHVLIGMKPLNKLLSNKAMLLEKFGTADRQSRSYADLVQYYLEVLATGVKAGPRFSPGVIKFEDKPKIIEEFQSSFQLMSRLLTDYSEAELDELTIPHPALGPLTLREMMMFMVYHVQHHLNSVKASLQSFGQSA